MNKNKVEFIVGVTRDIEIAQRGRADNERHSIPATADMLLQLMMRATIHQQYAEHSCNVGLTEAEKREDEKNEKAMIDICNPFGITPVFQADPRGATVKLKVPGGRTDDMGREGICVPVFQDEETSELILDEDTTDLAEALIDGSEFDEDDDDNE